MTRAVSTSMEFIRRSPLVRRLTLLAFAASYVLLTLAAAADTSTTTTTGSATTTLPAGATLWATGYNEHGQLGLGDTSDCLVFTQVGGDLAGKTITAAAGGFSHSLALISDGTLWVAGYNGYGELGLGDDTERHSFTQVGGVLADKNITAIAAGGSYSQVLASDGTLWATGANIYGQLGLGDTTNRSSFTQVGGNLAGETITAIAAGDRHSLILTGGGTLWAAGRNYSGQLGLGDTTNRSSFTQVGGDLVGKTITLIAAGEDHSLALADDGTLWAAGYNRYGQLGLGDDINRYGFTQVGGDLACKTITAIAAQGYGSFVLAADGTLWAAGYNYFGQLGLGDTTDRHDFTQVGGHLTGKTITAMAGARLHSLALANDGTLWATGYNALGELGLGDTSNRHSFSNVSGLLPVLGIAAGRDAHSFILTGPVSGYILVQYPSTSGIILEHDKTCVIRWKIANLSAKTPVKVELVKGGTQTWTLPCTGGKAIKGVDMYPDGSDYKIRVSTLDGSVSDESDNHFAIGNVESLTVSGPATVPGGTTPTQYMCTAHYSCGADRDVTNEVKWSCTKVKGVKMSKTGLLTAIPVNATQPCTITAAYRKGKPPVSGTLDITITR